MALDPQALKRGYEAQLDAASGDAHHGRRMFRAMLRASRELPAQRLAEDATVWVWSDLHFGHGNIIGYTNRPFADVEAMDRALWSNWEATVGSQDTVVFVGDIAMREAVAERTWQRIRSGPGRTKHLVVGNHDLTGAGELRVAGFDHIASVLCDDGDPPLVFTHLPLANPPCGCVNVHGHTHAEPPRQSPHINVSVEQLDYRPVALPRLRALAQHLAAGRYPAGATTLERLANMGL